MKTNIAMKILSAPEQTHIINSPDEALLCLELIKSNFKQTKEELSQLGLLDSPIKLSPKIKTLEFA